jgi:hypothetical protein
MLVPSRMEAGWTRENEKEAELYSKGRNELCNAFGIYSKLSL